MNGRRSLVLVAFVGVIAALAACTDIIGVKDYVATDESGSNGQMDTDATAVAVAPDSGQGTGASEGGDDDGSNGEDAGRITVDDDAGALDADLDATSDASCGAGSYCALVLASHPSAYFRFDDTVDAAAATKKTAATDGLALDSSGHGVVLELTGVYSATTAASAPIGDHGRGLLFGSATAFTGAGGGMYTFAGPDGGAGPSFTGVEPFTLELWFAPTMIATETYDGTDPTTENAFTTWIDDSSETGASANGFRLALGGNSTPATFAVSAESTMSVTLGTTVQTTQTFVHFAATFDGTTASLYVGGVANPATQMLFSGEGIGLPSIRSSASFLGEVDEIAVYPAVLTDAVIRSHATFKPR